MSTNTKPRICEVLGVEVGERFTIDGYPTDYGQAQVCEDGKVRRVLSRELSEMFGEVGHKIGSNALYYLLNHPESIIRKPRFTEDEVVTMRVLYAAGARYIARDYFGCLCWFCEEPEMPDRVAFSASGPGGDLPDGTFHTILPVQSVTIAEVIYGR